MLSTFKGPVLFSRHLNYSRYNGTQKYQKVKGRKCIGSVINNNIARLRYFGSIEAYPAKHENSVIFVSSNAN